MTAAASCQDIIGASDGDSSIDSMPEHDKELLGNGSIDVDLETMERPVKPSSLSSCTSTDLASDEDGRKKRTKRKSTGNGKIRKERRRRSSTKQRDEDSKSKARASRSRSMSNFDSVGRSRSTNRSVDDVGDSSQARRSKSLTKVKNKRSSKIRKSRRRHSSTKTDDDAAKNSTREQRRNRRERRKKRKSHSSKDGNGIEDTEIMSCSNHSARSSNRYDDEDSDATGQSGRSCKSYQSAPSSIPSFFDTTKPFGGVEDDDDLSVELVPHHHGISNNDHLRKLLANNLEALGRSSSNFIVDVGDKEEKEEESNEIGLFAEEVDGTEPPALVALDFSRDTHLRKVLADGMEAMEQSLTSFNFDPEAEQTPLPAEDVVVVGIEDDDSAELVALDFSRDANLRKKLAEGIEAMEKSLTSLNFNGDAQAFDSDEEQTAKVLGDSWDNVNVVPGSATAVEDSGDPQLQETASGSIETSDPIVKSCVVEDDKPTDNETGGRRPKRNSFRFSTDRMNLSFQNLKEALGNTARKRISRTNPIPDLSGLETQLTNYDEVDSDDELDLDIDDTAETLLEKPLSSASFSIEQGSPQPSPPSSSRRLNLPFMSRRRRGPESVNQDNVESNTGVTAVLAASHSAVQDEKTGASCHQEGGNDLTPIVQDVNEDLSPRSVTTIGLRLAKTGNTLQKRLQALSSNRSGRETPSTQSCADLRSVDNSHKDITFACDMDIIPTDSKKSVGGH